MVYIYNSDAQSKEAFRKGQYVIANILYYPVDNVTTGIEYQWGQRDNLGGFISIDTIRRFSFLFSTIFRSYSNGNNKLIITPGNAYFSEIKEKIKFFPETKL